MNIKPGDMVTLEQILVVLESMKMEKPRTVKFVRTVQASMVTPGLQVQCRQV
ncbi:MAG: hypothetical protein M1472_00340 [Planctomycetes bacterium]|nr:hypothetical protein [Planctomycetota bacterium]